MGVLMVLVALVCCVVLCCINLVFACVLSVFLLVCVFSWGLYIWDRRAGSSVVELSIATRMVTGSIPVSRSAAFFLPSSRLFRSTSPLLFAIALLSAYTLYTVRPQLKRRRPRLGAASRAARRCVGVTNGFGFHAGSV